MSLLKIRFQTSAVPTNLIFFLKINDVLCEVYKDCIQCTSCTSNIIIQLINTKGINNIINTKVFM